MLLPAPSGRKIRAIESIFSVPFPPPPLSVPSCSALVVFLSPLVPRCASCALCLLLLLLLCAVSIVFRPLEKCGRFCTSREGNAGTRSVPSSGRWCARSMGSTPREHTRECRICSWSASMCTTMRPAVEGMCPGRCSWTWSPAPWIACGRGHMDRSSDPITSCSDRAALVTTGPKVTTQKAPS